MSQPAGITRGFKPWFIFAVVIIGIALLAYGCELAQARLRQVGMLPTLTLVPTRTSTLTPSPTSTRLPTSTTTETAIPTHTPVPSDTPVPTHTPVPTDTPISARVVTPAPTLPPAAIVDSRPVVTLLIDPVPVRFGPGDTYKIVWQATRADDIRLASDPGGTPWLMIAKGDQTGWVKKNSVRVGNAAPEPAPAVSSSAELSAYTTELSQHIQDIGGALQALGALTKAYDLASTDWKINVATQMAIIRVSHQRITEMAVPPEMANIHTAVLDATSDCDQAMLYMANGIDNFSTDDLKIAADLITSCGKKTAIPLAMIKTFQAQK